MERLKRSSHGLRTCSSSSVSPCRRLDAIYAIADALLVHLKDDPLFEITIPSKIQAYLFAGKPILCGVKGDAADLVRMADAGITFLPEDPGSLHRAVLTLRKLGTTERLGMGSSGRKFYQDHLSMREGVRHMEAMLQVAVSMR